MGHQRFYLVGQTSGINLLFDTLDIYYDYDEPTDTKMVMMVEERNNNSILE